MEIEHNGQLYVLSLKKHGEQKLSPNFKVKEFASNDGADVVLLDPAIVHIAQAVRDEAQKPYSPNSAYRSSYWNRKVGGARYSQHLYGKALDIPVEPLGWTVDGLAEFLYNLKDSYGVGYIIIYRKKGFVHVDTRDKPKRLLELTNGNLQQIRP